MGYQAELQSNNVDLQSILNTINELPDASSGGTNLETCTVTLDDSNAPSLAQVRVVGTKLVDGVITPFNVMDTNVITDVLCDSILYIFDDYGGDVKPTGFTGNISIVEDFYNLNKLLYILPRLFCIYFLFRRKW